MEKFGEWVNKFAETPAGIIIASALSLLLILIYVFSKTSIGRKALKELREKTLTTRSLVETHQNNVDTNLKEEKVKNDKMLKEVFAIVEEERKEFFEVLKLVPNAKVKKFVKDHENMSVNDLLNKVKKDAKKGE